MTVRWQEGQGGNFETLGDSPHECQSRPQGQAGHIQMQMWRVTNSLIAESTADVYTFSKANELEEKNNITLTQEEIKDMNYFRN